MRSIFSHLHLYFPENFQRSFEVVLLPHHRIVLQIQDPQRPLQITRKEGTAASHRITLDLKFHHPDVLDPRLKIRDPRLKRGGWVVFDLLVEGGKLCDLTVDLALLDGQLPLNNTLVRHWKVLLPEMVLHHQEADDEIVPCVIFRIVFLYHLTQTPFNEEVLDQFVVGLAVVLIPHALLSNSLAHFLFLRPSPHPLTPLIFLLFHNPLIFSYRLAQTLILLQIPKVTTLTPLLPAHPRLSLGDHSQRLRLLRLISQARQSKIVIR